MGRGLLVAMLAFVALSPAYAQAPGTLRLSVALTDSAGTTTPIARHALLISDEPPTFAPRRILTSPTGTAEVSLRPGRYVIGSDQPVAFGGRTYEWSQRIEIVAGREATLALTTGNAAIDTSPLPPPSTSRADTDPSVIAARWRDAVVGLWMPTQHASGFLVDARGVIVTSQRVVGTATTVEAQLSPDTQVVATVLAADATRDVAILRVHPSVVASLQPLPLGCDRAVPRVTNAQELYAIGARMTGEKRLTPGAVTGVGPRLLLADLRVGRGSAGGPVFAASGLVGFTTLDERERDGDADARVVRIGQVCDVLAAAEKTIAEAMPPDPTRLPLASQQPIAPEALAAAAKTRAGNLSPYVLSTADFDLAFITPLHVYAAKTQGRREAMDFGTWSEYLADTPRVLLVRVTPKLAEGLWAKVARGAAMTQGVSLPAMKRPKAGFSRMRIVCGGKTVTPIHPFLVEQRVSATEAVYEGLYVVDPAALGPHCGTVEVTVFSEENPDKADTRSVDPAVLEQLARDFAAF